MIYEGSCGCAWPRRSEELHDFVAGKLATHTFFFFLSDEQYLIQNSVTDTNGSKPPIRCKTQQRLKTSQDPLQKESISRYTSKTKEKVKKNRVSRRENITTKPNFNFWKLRILGKLVGRLEWS